MRIGFVTLYFHYLNFKPTDDVLNKKFDQFSFKNNFYNIPIIQILVENLVVI